MRLRSALLFSACACLVATCQRTLPANLKKDIDAGNQAWVDGLKTGDANHVVAGFAQDCLNCNAAGDCVKGLEPVTAQCQKIISKFGHATSGFVRSETLHVDHDLAYESGYSEARFPHGVVLKGRFSTVWKRQSDGHWKIFRNISLPAGP
jgi:ketosteroid isomerase-like protein